MGEWIIWMYGWYDYNNGGNMLMGNSFWVTFVEVED
jgi:hypothetical protein